MDLSLYASLRYESGGRLRPGTHGLRGAHEQALNHFVTNSPWGVTPVHRRIAERIDEALNGAAWAIDDTGLLKYGTMSPCVARQYTGTAGSEASRISCAPRYVRAAAGWVSLC